MDLGLQDKRVIITGGTRGIGAAMVCGFLAEGAHVHFCARNAGEIASKLKDFKSVSDRVAASVCDVGNVGTYSSYVSEAITFLGGVDVFVANVSGGSGTGEEGWKTAFDVDLMASVRGADLVLPAMAQQKSGAILFLSSIMATEQMGAPGPYATIKSALVSYAAQLSEAAAPHGVRVNSLSPGPIHVDDGFWGSVSQQNPDAYAATVARHPMGRLGTPEEVANAAVFLCSDKASWITATNTMIDGGFSKRIQF